MLGFLVGVLVFGIVADKYGRRVGIIVSHGLGVCFALLMAIAPNYALFAVAKFLTTACYCGSYLVAFVICMEVVGGSFYRGLVANIFWFGFAFGYMALALWAYLVQDWRWLIVTLALPSCIMFSMIW